MTFACRQSYDISRKVLSLEDIGKSFVRSQPFRIKSGVYDWSGVPFCSDLKGIQGHAYKLLAVADKLVMQNEHIAFESAHQWKIEWNDGRWVEIDDFWLAYQDAALKTKPNESTRAEKIGLAGTHYRPHSGYYEERPRGITIGDSQGPDF